MLERERDVVKLLCDGTRRLIVGIENQELLNYGEPARVMMYDALEYDRQINLIKYVHREKQDVKGDEYVSRFAREDRLIPVVTIVVYYGREPWTFPHRLGEILESSAGVGRIWDGLQDYGIRVIEVRRLSDEIINLIDSDVKLLFGCIKYDRDKVRMMKFIQDNEEHFRRLPKETVELIAIMTRSEKLLEEVRKDKEKCNMCKAFEDMIKDGRIEGRLEGRLEAKRQCVIELLELNGTVSEELRARVEAEEDMEKLTNWYKFAAKSDTIEEFLERIS